MPVAEQWRYDNQDAWKDTWPACGGRRQSPINIRTGDVLFNDDSLAPLNLSYSVGPYTVEKFQENSGEGFLVRPVFPISQHFRGGDLASEYLVDHFHAHWSQESTDIGSEHVISGIFYPFEAHIVHYRADFANIGEALASGEGDALAVVGIIFEMGEYNPAFDPWLPAASQVLIASSATVQVEDVSLSALLPDVVNYFTYEGSLTTPGCEEIVQWFVLSERPSISQEQLGIFQSLMMRHPNETSTQVIGDTFRNVQDLNGRIIRANFNPNALEYLLPGSVFFFVVAALYIIGVVTLAAKFYLNGETFGLKIEASLRKLSYVGSTSPVAVRLKEDIESQREAQLASQRDPANSGTEMTRLNESNVQDTFANSEN